MMQGLEGDTVPKRIDPLQSPVRGAAVGEVLEHPLGVQAMTIEGVNHPPLLSLLGCPLAVLRREPVVEHPDRVQQVGQVTGMADHVCRRLGRDDGVVAADVEVVAADVRFEDCVEARFVDRNSKPVDAVTGSSERALEAVVLGFGPTPLARSHDGDDEPQLHGRGTFRARIAEGLSTWRSTGSETTPMKGGWGPGTTSKPMTLSHQS